MIELEWKWCEQFRFLLKANVARVKYSKFKDLLENISNIDNCSIIPTRMISADSKLWFDAQFPI